MPAIALPSDLRALVQNYNPGNPPVYAPLYWAVLNHPQVRPHLDANQVTWLTQAAQINLNNPRSQGNIFVRSFTASGLYFSGDRVVTNADLQNASTLIGST